MNYIAYELAHAFITPLRFLSTATRLGIENPWSPFAHNPFAKSTSAALQVFEELTKRYGKPAFELTETTVRGLKVPVQQRVVWQKPFCDLVHFARDTTTVGPTDDPKVLIVAPMSGHYATLLRGTVAAMASEHEVYITDWKDARVVPLADGRFDLDDYVDYLIDMVQALGPDTHVIAVCQPAVPALVATAVMAARGSNIQPASLTLMGGPIDTRRNPTAVNHHAMSKSVDWFERNVISYVPFPHSGFMRRVYPGFIQLGGFMSMNMERHQSAFKELFDNLVTGDCDSVDQHRKFYDEYLAVMDLPAEFFLQTVKTVFQDHDLPDGRWRHRGELIDCSAISQTALMTVEGERDDICGVGQTEAAHSLCSKIPADEKFHYLQPGVGHYGVFNGTRFRTEIQPRIREMIRTIQRKRRQSSQMYLVPEAADSAPVTKAAMLAPYIANGAWEDAQPTGKPN